MEFSKLCNGCGRKQKYSRKSQLTESLKKNRLCNSCKQLGSKNPFFGKKHTKEHNLFISEWNKNRGDVINKKISDKLKPLNIKKKYLRH